MHFSFHTEGFRFVFFTATLMWIIFGTGIYSANKIAEIVYERETLGYTPLANVLQKKEIYKNLTDSAALASSSEEILRRRDLLIAGKKNFIFADLDAMRLTFYAQDTAPRAFPILARGKKETFFETPSGDYSIKSKEVNHFSSIGSVWMPWSMHFYGNYFVHGWPYYPDGKQVSSAFSGGCIRLATKDAKVLYNLTESGIPMLVYAGGNTLDLAPQDFLYFQKQVKVKAEIAPLLSAASVLAADFDTGQVLYQKESNAAHPIASLTKIMTALAAIEHINRFKPLAMTKSAQAEPGSSSGIPVGEIFTTEKYMYPLLLASANDVAAILEQTALNLPSVMNAKAKAIGLTQTFFRDASGFSEFNVSSTQDIFALLRFVASHKEPIFSILGTREKKLAGTYGKIYTWTNRAWDPADPAFIAGKTGTTASAGEAFAGVFRLKVSEFETRSIAIIVLKSQDRNADIAMLRKYIEDNFFYGTAALVRAQKGRPLIIQEGAALFEALYRM